MHGVITLCCLFPRLAFERSLELDPRCVGALVGLALLELNSKQVKNCTRKLQVMDLHTEGVGSGDETGKLHVTGLHAEGGVWGRDWETACYVLVSSPDPTLSRGETVW